MRAQNRPSRSGLKDRQLMVSGFLISPYDHDRIFSGEARAMRIWSKVGATGTGLKMFRTSWFIGFPDRRQNSEGDGERLTAPPLTHVEWRRPPVSCSPAPRSGRESASP